MELIIIPARNPETARNILIRKVLGSAVTGIFFDGSTWLPDSLYTVDGIIRFALLCFYESLASPVSRAQEEQQRENDRVRIGIEILKNRLDRVLLIDTPDLSRARNLCHLALDRASELRHAIAGHLNDGNLYWLTLPNQADLRIHLQAAWGYVMLANWLVHWETMQFLVSADATIDPFQALRGIFERVAQSIIVFGRIPAPNLPIAANENGNRILTSCHLMQASLGMLSLINHPPADPNMDNTFNDPVVRTLALKCCAFQTYHLSKISSNGTACRLEYGQTLQENDRALEAHISFNVRNATVHLEPFRQGWILNRLYESNIWIVTRDNIEPVVDNVDMNHFQTLVRLRLNHHRFWRQ